MRLILTLGLAGFFAGIVLVSAYTVTKPLIDAHAAAALEAAVYEVLPGTESLTPLVVDEEGHWKEAAGEDTGLPVAFVGRTDQGVLTGVAIPREQPGFQDVIKGLFGYHPGREMVTGMVVLESRETPGLGDKIIKDQRFRDQFLDLGVANGLQTVKKGQAVADGDVEAITGATISSKAVVKMIDAGIAENKADDRGILENQIVNE